MYFLEGKEKTVVAAVCFGFSAGVLKSNSDNLLSPFPWLLVSVGARTAKLCPPF